MAESVAVRWRAPLLWLAGARVALSLVAIPLAPFLYREHFVVLVLLRPTKEVLLAGGFFIRDGRVSLPLLLVAAVPLLIFGVWHFFFLGRGYAKEIKACSLPGPADRLLPAKRINALQKVLRKRGEKLVFVGRLAVFPSSLVAAAAGSSRMKTRPFLLADGLGGLASVVEVVGAGYLLGQAYESAGRWITVAGVVALGVLLYLGGRYLKRAES